MMMRALTDKTENYTEYGKDITNRLARSVGHLKSVKRMVENERDCSEVLVQLAAVKSEVNNTGLMIKRILSVGVPVGLQSMLLTLSNLFVQYYINELGENAVAAFSVYFKVENLIYLPIMAFGQAMLTFTGQNIGAGHIRRIQKGAVICNIFSAAVVACISAAVLNFGTQILGCFCKEEAVIEEGMKVIGISFPFYFIYAILEVTGGIVRGYKKTMQSMFIVIVNLCVIRVLLLKFFTSRYHTIQAVATVYPITWVLAAISFIIYYNFRAKKSFMLV